MFTKENDLLTFRAAFFETVVLFPLANYKFRPVWLDRFTYRTYEWLLKKDKEAYRKYLSHYHSEPH